MSWMAPEGQVFKSTCPSSLLHLNRHLFPVALGLYSFALINLSHDYNLLLSLVSPFAKSLKLRGGHKRSSTGHKIFQDIKISRT